MNTKIRVIVAEDIELLREDFCEIIDGQEDMKVVAAVSSGEAAVAAARETACDMILMDIEMETVRAGIEAAEIVHAEHPQLNIVFLTAHETVEMINSGMGSGAVDYIVKGCPEETLLEHIRKVYQGCPALDFHIQQVVMQEFNRLRRSERSLIFFIHNVAKLTSAEHEMVKLLLQDKKVAEIAALRCVEIVTVKTQIKGLLSKFGCSRSKEIVAIIRQMGLEHLFS